MYIFNQNKFIQLKEMNKWELKKEVDIILISINCLDDKSLAYQIIKKEK